MPRMTRLLQLLFLLVSVSFQKNFQVRNELLCTARLPTPPARTTSANGSLFSIQNIAQALADSKLALRYVWNRIEKLILAGIAKGESELSSTGKHCLVGIG